MKRFLGALLALTLAGACLGQELINYSTPPYDSAPAGAAKINTNTSQLFNMFGVTGVLCGHGAVPNAMTACTYANIVALFSGCNAGAPFLSYNGTCMAGGGGGSGNVSVSGTPAAGQIAQWVSPTAIQGIATTGAGNPVLATSPTITTPTLINPSATALTVTGNLTTNVTGSSQCVQVNTSGVISGTGAACGGSSSGTVGSGTTNQVPYYAASGTTLTAATLGNNLAISGGVLGGTQLINAQTGTSYAIATTDAGKLVTLSNSSSIAVSLSAATTTGFTAGFSFDIQNVGVGTATITPATSTINGAATISLAANTGCTVTSDGTNYQVSACSALVSGGGSGAYNTLNLCIYPGVDPTGASNSLPAVTTAFSTYGGTNTVIQVNCPIFLNFGSSGTSQIYVKSYTNVSFGSTGSFIVNNVGVNAFVLANVTDGLWNCNNEEGCIQYVANAGALLAGCGPNCGVYAAGVTAEFASMKTFLQGAPNNITFSGGTGPAWQGQSPFLAIFNLRGATQRIVFRNMTVTAPQTASVANYIPTVFGFYFEYNPGVTATSSTLSYSYMSFPTDIEFDHPTIDGYQMGFQGSCDCRIFDAVGKRYSDMQDGTGNGTSATSTITFSASLGSGVTSATLAASWTLPTGIYAVTLSNAQAICMTLTQGSTAATAFINCNSGASYPTSSTATATASAGNMGGYANWAAPPHMFYLYDQGITGTPQRIQFSNIIDYGISNVTQLLTAERSTGSGSLLSWKGHLTNNSSINGYISLRPEGFHDDIACTSACGGSAKNIYVVYNSTTPTSNSGTVWAMRFLGITYDQNFDGVTIIDTATEPGNNPIPGGIGYGGSYDFSMTNVKYYLNDWPAAATWYPGFQLAGVNHFKLQGEVHFANCSATQGFRGSVEAVGSNVLTNADIDVSVFGWRQLPTTFSAAPANGATSATLAANWPYSSGTYKVFFNNSTSDIRYISFTNGSTTIGSFTALTSAAAATGNTAGNALVNNYTGYENRIILSQSGAATGIHAHLRDVDNNWEATSDGSVTKEDWRQEYLVSGVTGTTVTTPIIFPATFGIVGTGWAVTTAFTGATGTFGIGFSGATTALIAAANISTTNVGQPAAAPYTSPGTAVLITSSAGSITGGVGNLGVEGVSYVGSH